MSSSQTMTNNTNTQLHSCAKHDCNTTPTRRLSSSSSSETIMHPQLSQTMLTVFSMLHFFMSLNNYIELGEYCSTCRLLFKFKKHTNYKIMNYHSYMYKRDETFRAKVLSRIANPPRQLYLDLFFDILTVEELSVLGNVYSLNLCGCTILNLCNKE